MKYPHDGPCVHRVELRVQAQAVVWCRASGLGFRVEGVEGVGGRNSACLWGSEREREAEGDLVLRFGSRVRGSVFSVQCSVFRVQSSGFRVQGPGFRVQGSDFRGLRVRGFKFWV